MTVAEEILELLKKEFERGIIPEASNTIPDSLKVIKTGLFKIHDQLLRINLQLQRISMEDYKKLGIGTILHYNDEGTCTPAVVTKVLNQDVVDLFVIGAQQLTEIYLGKVGGSWHWPEKV